jgi:hypothetical protein
MFGFNVVSYEMNRRYYIAKKFGASTAANRKCVEAAATFAMFMRANMADAGPKSCDFSYSIATSKSPLRRRCVRRNRCNRGTIRDRRGRAGIADWRRRGARHNWGRAAKPIAAATTSTAKAESENRYDEPCSLHDCVSVLSRNIR